MNLGLNVKICHILLYGVLFEKGGLIEKEGLFDWSTGVSWFWSC